MVNDSTSTFQELRDKRLFLAVRLPSPTKERIGSNA